ncbi:uncharacterized protein LAESUDRAFT_738864 [Laetiporus sulphureus 93-53]|uniref:Uncharacterized protein n=1 Tax=Laetiporus sulphureus 93-53 TaxID=1314785 RepID=A0A165C6E1_9APHY|nr:uncharacterized protein LAESUDRAFT_738864 [Laetiporus sulphureus 93-53]KZT02282.1 hypothetical protein LAESUDRAFT_738864 [Laetiporus sulphureus 93-53]
MPTNAAVTTEDVGAAAPASISLKAASSPTSPTSSNSTAAALRSLYPRAARAFLQRDTALTHALLASAFTLLAPPPAGAGTPDPLAGQRRKWEILRITFETTLYAAPAAQDSDTVALPLREDLLLSPQPFIATVYNRSLALFTPAHPPRKPTAAFLPAQILVTLVLASLKLGCTQVGRGMVEEWLARRGGEEGAEDAEGYAKVLELYCLHVLPRLEEWDYAEEFIQLEMELPLETRKYMITSLHSLHAQGLAVSQRNRIQKSIPPSATEPILPPARSASPASSASSGSTHTATPTTPRPGGKSDLQSLTHMQPSPHSGSSQSISSAATSRTVTPALVERQRSRSSNRTRSRRGAQARSRDPRSGSSTRGAISPIPRPPRALPVEAPQPRPPTTLALVRSSLEALLHSMSRARLTAYLLFFVVFPLLSFVFRLRRRRTSAGPGPGPAPVGKGAVEEVRRRLRNGPLVETKSAGGLLRQMWEELVRAVSDTVQMGGRGLV